MAVNQWRGGAPFDALIFFFLGTVSFNLFAPSFPAQYFHEGALSIGALLTGLGFAHGARLREFPRSPVALGLLLLSCLIALSGLRGQAVYVYQWLLPALALAGVALAAPPLFAANEARRANPPFDLLLLALVLGALYQAISGVADAFGFNRALPLLFNALPWNGRVVGNLGQANLYAHLLAWGAVSALWLSTRAPGRHWRRRAFGATAFFLLLAGAWSMSRTYFGYMLWLLLAGSYLRFRVGGELAAFGTALIAAGAFGAVASANDGWLTFLAQRDVDHLFGASRTATLDTRLILWQKAWLIFADSPLTGAGWGSIAKLGQDLNLTVPRPINVDQTTSEHAHNLFAQFGAELGLAGLCALAFLLWHGARAVLRSHATTRWPAMLLLGISLLHSMFEYPLWNVSFLVVVVLLVVLHERPEHFTLPDRGVSGVRVVAVLALAATVLLVAAWSTLSRAALHGDSNVAPGVDWARRVPGMDFPVDVLAMLRQDRAPFGSPQRLQALRRLNAYLPNSLVKAHTLCELGRHRAAAEQAREYAIFVASFPASKPRIDLELRRFQCALPGLLPTPRPAAVSSLRSPS